MNLPAHRPLAPWRVALWSGAALLWLLPALAMQFTREVRWGPGDFLVFGVMLAAACAGFEGIARLGLRTRTRWLAGAAVVAGFLLVWAELAVGIFS